MFDWYCILKSFLLHSLEIWYLLLARRSHAVCWGRHDVQIYQFIHLHDHIHSDILIWKYGSQVGEIEISNEIL